MHIHTPIEQIKNHLIAIVSLFIAITALTYNTWRDEETEKNRNIRQASFEVLKHLGELQIVLNYAHYQTENSMGNPILGWGHIALVSDMGQLLPSPIPEKTSRLAQIWSENWKNVSTDENAVELVSRQVDDTRDAVLGIIRNLK